MGNENPGHWGGVYLHWGLGGWCWHGMHSRKIRGRMEGQKMVEKVELLQWVSMFSQAMKRNHGQVLWGAWSFHAWTAIQTACPRPSVRRLPAAWSVPPFFCMPYPEPRLGSIQATGPLTDIDRSPTKTKVRGGEGRGASLNRVHVPRSHRAAMSVAKFHAQNTHSEWLHNLFRLKKRRRNRSIPGKIFGFWSVCPHLHV